MGISDIADGLGRRIEGLGASVSEGLFEPVIRLGVTGLSRAGKTVFITSLVANLLDRGRMPALAGASNIRAAFLQPQPDDTVPRFDYERYLSALTGPAPHWPEGTRAVSELRLSFRVAPTGLLGGLRGLRTVHLDIVDYPGEWLLDLGLMEKSYAQWSEGVLARIGARPALGSFGSCSFDERRYERQGTWREASCGPATNFVSFIRLWAECGGCSAVRGQSV